LEVKPFCNDGAALTALDRVRRIGPYVHLRSSRGALSQRTSFVNRSLQLCACPYDL